MNSASRMPPIGISAVILLSAFILFFSVAPMRGLFWLHPGDFGVTADSSLRVTEVDSPGPAYRAGIRVGDRFGTATSFEKRLYLQSVRNPAPGQLLELQVKGKNASQRTVDVVAEMDEFDASDIAGYFPWVVVDLIFVLVGSTLVLLRPSTMTWAFFFYCVGADPGLVLGYYWLPAWLVFTSGAFVNVLQAFGFAAFLIFCMRVPNGCAMGGWRYVEWILAPVIFVSVLLCSAAIELSIVGVLHADVVAGQIRGAILDATYVVGILVLLARFYKERGVERSRVAWIIAGFAIGLGARVATNLSAPDADIYTGAGNGPAALPLLPALEVAIPLMVALAVIRHRALNIGLTANRTLVYGLFLCAGFAVFALLDLLVTKRFARNQFEIGLDIAIALAVGLSFQFVHPRAIRLIDRIFLPERYQAAIALDRLRDSLSAMRNQDDAPNRAVEAATKELMISSLAIFKKVPDGGFVRFASAGWPKGSAWHIFAGDPLVQLFSTSRRVRIVDEVATERLRITLGPGRPTIGISLSAQTAGESLLLVGAHVGGRRPDRDEVRGIASVLSEFANHRPAANLDGSGGWLRDPGDLPV
jgi:hypothetical protein